jgi:signal transduction histidine kinase
VRILLFQSVRELLMNALKHSHASTVSIHLSSHGDNIVCTVKDDGKGFPSRKLRAGSPHRDGMGLFTIRERLQPVGGNLEISSRPGRGTTAELTAPRELATEPLPHVKDPYEETADRTV